MSQPEFVSLEREYQDLDARLERDGFEASTRKDVLASLVYARTAPRSLQAAADLLHESTPTRDLEAFRALGPSVDSEVRASICVLMHNRMLRARDSRYRRWFADQGIKDMPIMVAATLEALFCRVGGRGIDEDQILHKIQRRQAKRS